MLHWIHRHVSQYLFVGLLGVGKLYSSLCLRPLSYQCFNRRAELGELSMVDGPLLPTPPWLSALVVASNVIGPLMSLKLKSIVSFSGTGRVS